MDAVNDLRRPPPQPPRPAAAQVWRPAGSGRRRAPAVAAALAGLLALGALLGLAGTPEARAASVRTALAAPSGDGARHFLADLAELWRNRFEPTPEQLVVRAVPGPDTRLRLVNRGRADFAVVNAATAAGRLADYPRLTALAVLWPDLLHAVSRNPAAQELKQPFSSELWLLDSAAFVAPTLAELAQGDRAQQAQAYRVPDSVLVDALAYADQPVLLFTAPVPVAELTSAMARDPRLQVLPIANPIVDELKLAYPWLVTEKLGRSAYPGQQRNLELPAVYQVLIGRRDLPTDTARKVLDTVYGRSNAMVAVDPLFGQTNGAMNAVFGKLMPFHPETARRFSFTPSVP